jgi:hypothetical protein
MATPEFLVIDPRAPHLPSSRLSGADPIKPHDQMARFGSSVTGMPPVLAYRGSDSAIMRHPAMTSRELKQDILRALAELVEHTPDVRFGQLIANLVVIARGPTPEAVWDMEDDELLEAVKCHIEDYDRRHAGAA